MKKKSTSINSEMQEAFILDDLDKMKVLVASGLADVNECDARRKSMATPLIRSAINSNGHEYLRWFLKNGANVNQKDGAGWTALHFACEYKNLDSVKLLIEAGADINSKNNMGATPLLRLLARNDARNQIILKYMIGNGADPKIKNNSGISVFDFADAETINWLQENSA